MKSRLLIGSLALQMGQQQVDELSTANRKLLKRQGRTEEALVQDMEDLKDELAKTRLDLDASHTRFRETVQTRDAQLAAADTQAMSMRGHIEVLEGDLKRLNEQAAAREKELKAAFDDKLSLELKQQQLRYDGRLQMMDFESRRQMMGSVDVSQADALRKVLQEEQRLQPRVSDTEPAKLDQSIREAVNQHLPSVLREITNRDDSALVCSREALTCDAVHPGVAALCPASRQRVPDSMILQVCRVWNGGLNSNDSSWSHSTKASFSSRNSRLPCAQMSSAQKRPLPPVPLRSASPWNCCKRRR